MAHNVVYPVTDHLTCIIKLIVTILNCYLYSAKYMCIWSTVMHYTVRLSKIKWYENELQKAKSIQFD